MRSGFFLLPSMTLDEGRNLRIMAGSTNETETDTMKHNNDG